VAKLAGTAGWSAGQLAAAIGGTPAPAAGSGPAAPLHPGQVKALLDGAARLNPRHRRGQGMNMPASQVQSLMGAHLAMLTGGAAAAVFSASSGSGLGSGPPTVFGTGKMGGGGTGPPTRFDKGGYLRPGMSLAWNGTGRPEPVTPAGAGTALEAKLDKVVARLDAHIALTRKLIDTTAAVPQGVGRHLSGAIGGATSTASFRSRYSRGGA